MKRLLQELRDFAPLLFAVLFFAGCLNGSEGVLYATGGCCFGWLVGRAVSP